MKPVGKSVLPNEVIRQIPVKRPEKLVISEIATGHIHRTCFVYQEGKPHFVVQKINTGVFKDAELLLFNHQTAVDVLDQQHWCEKSGICIPRLVSWKTGSNLLKVDDKDYWRILSYIPHQSGLDVSPNYQMLFESGKAFGNLLSGFRNADFCDFKPVFPDFHSLQMRQKQFKQAVDANLSGRFSEAKELVHQCFEMAESLNSIPDGIQKGILPLQLTHNDTKLNNILFDDKQKAAGIVDFDTIMPGSPLFDFGDAIRSGANTAAEDERNLSSVRFSIGNYRAFTEGFTYAVRSFITEAELKLLPEAARLITFIIGIRFLTDYLNGDAYFKIQYPEHNLVRAKVQFKLIEEMDSQIASMQQAVETVFN